MQRILSALRHTFDYDVNLYRLMCHTSSFIHLTSFYLNPFVLQPPSVVMTRGGISLISRRFFKFSFKNSAKLYGHWYHSFAHLSRTQSVPHRQDGCNSHKCEFLSKKRDVVMLFFFFLVKKAIKCFVISKQIITFAPTK